MAKITKVEEKKSTYQGKEKVSYLFTLDDGITGYASNKSPWEFKEGDNVSYTREVKKSSKGEYNLFTFTKVEGQSSGGVPTPPQPPQKTFNIPHAEVDIAKWKFDSRMQLCKLTHDLMLNGKFTDQEAQLHVTTWANIMDNLIDGIFAR